MSTAEAQLKASEERLRLALAAANAAAWETDLTTGANAWDSRLAEMLGVAPEDAALAQTRWTEFIHPEDVPRVTAAFEAARAPGASPFEAEFRVRHTGGKVLWLLSRGVQVDGSDGSRRMVGIVQDITERKHREEKLRESEERLRLALESGEMGAWEWWIPDNRATVDEKTRALWDLDPGDAGGDPEEFFRRIVPEDRRHWEEGIRQALETGAAYQDAFRIRVRKGGTRWLAGFGRVEFAPDGKPLVMRGVNFDITARKQAEERAVEVVRESEAFVRGILDALPEHVVVLNEQGVVIAVNEPWTRFASENGGTPAAVSVGANYLEVCRRAAEEGDESARAAHEGLLAVLARRQTLFTLEYPCHAPGRDQWFLMLAQRPHQGEAAVILSHVDISQRKQAEEALRRRGKQLALLGRVSELLANVEQPEDEPLAEIIAETAEFLGMEMYCHYRPSAAGLLRLDHFGGISTADKQHFATMREGELLCGRVAATREMLAVEDLQNAGVEGCELLKAGGVTSYLGFPLLAHGNLLGTLAFVSRRKLRFEEGEVETVRTVCLRISVLLERARLVREVAQSQQRLAHVLSHSPAGIVQADAHGRMTMVNERWCEMTGYSESELLGRSVVEVTHPQSVNATVEILRQLRAGVAECRVEKQYVRKDGSPLHAESTVSALRAEDGAFTGLVAVVLDISARKKAEEALAQQRGLLKAVTDNARVSLFMMDAQQHCVFMNPAAEQLTGFTFPEVVGRPLHDLIHHTRPDGTPYPLAECPIDRALPEQNQTRGEEVFVHRDGHFYPVEFTASPMRDAEGRPFGTIIEVQDITERQRAEAELRAAKDEAEAASRAKDRFLAALSHELRTPLTPVLMAATWRERDRTLPAEVRQDFATIRRNLELEVKLIDDLLDVSRIIAGKVTVDIVPVELNEAVARSCAICAAQAEERGVRLVFERSCDELWASTDPSRLQQILWNVVRNAIKFTPARGTVRLDLWRAEDGQCSIRVQDTGVGIPMEKLEHIFEPFEQGGEDTTRVYGGLGLGLAISKGLVEAQGGTITAESRGKGQGATFTIGMPSAPAVRQGSAASSTGSKAAQATRKPRLLLVEDHAETGRTLLRLLKRAGFVAKHAADMASALELAHAEQWDLVVTDIGLPDGTGHELLRLLREGGPVRAIAMSGFGMDADVQHSLQAGFSEHLVKPVTLERLVAAIRKTLAEQ